MPERELSMEEKGYWRIPGEDVYIHPSLLSEDKPCPFGGNMLLENYDLVDALVNGLMTPDGVVTPAGEKYLKDEKNSKLKVGSRKSAPVLGHSFSTPKPNKKGVTEGGSVPESVEPDSPIIVRGNRVTNLNMKRLMKKIEEKELMDKVMETPEENFGYDTSLDEDVLEPNVVKVLLSKGLITKNPDFPGGEDVLEYIFTEEGLRIMRGDADNVSEEPESKSKKTKGERNPNWGNVIEDIFLGLEPNFKGYGKFEMKKIDNGSYIVRIILNSGKKYRCRIDKKFLDKLDSENKKMFYIRNKLIELLKNREDDMSGNY